MSFLPYFLLIVGFLHIFMSLVCKATGNHPLASAFVFKVIPFFIGFTSLLYAVKLLGWV